MLINSVTRYNQNYNNYQIRLNKKTPNPAFKGEVNIFEREAGIILDSLTPAARKKVGTTMYNECFSDGSGGIMGKLYLKVLKFQNYLMKKDCSGEMEFVLGSMEQQTNELATELISNYLLPEYMLEAFKKNNKTKFIAKSFDESAIQGEGFKLRKTGIELDETIRKQLINTLEESKTYKEFQTKIKTIKSIYEL